jgi:uncharacterized membrane protein
MRSKRFGDLVLIAVWVVANLVFIPLAAPTWAKVALAVPLVLGLTGYAITAALFPNKQLGKAERLLFVITLSSAASALGGILLNLTATGLRQNTWLAYLCAVTLMACAVAVGRRVYAVRRASTVLPVSAPPRTPSAPLLHRVVQGGLFVCAGLIAIVAIVLARIPPTPAEGLEGYTLLWVLPPGTGQNTDARTARVGVQSSEFAPTQYRLQVQQAGNVLYEWQLKLQPGEQWESEALTIPNQLNELVKVLLVRSDVPSVIYRQVAYWPNKPTQSQTLEAK